MRLMRFVSLRFFFYSHCFEMRLPPKMKLGLLVSFGHYAGVEIKRIAL